MQVFPWQQPEEHEAVVQPVRLTQIPPLHSLPRDWQFVHAEPFLPHWLMLTLRTHWLDLMQVVQQAPLRHFPALAPTVQDTVEGWSVCLQVLAEQESLVQVFPSSQSSQALPPDPHRVKVLPA